MRIFLALAFVPALAFAGTFQDSQHKYPRVRDAQARKGPAVELMFRERGAAWPPKIHLRGFKDEGHVELWAAPREGKRWVKVHTFPVCAASGILGPKRQVGDGQVPEGFYFIDRFNPRSSFHLSLGLNYPNAVDRARKLPAKSLGGDIFIHGDCVTIGCLPLRDGPMESLYLAAVAARSAGQKRIPVHVFPCRMDTDSCRDLLTKTAAENRELGESWVQLRPGYFAFEALGRPPRIRTTKSGAYVLRDKPRR